MTKEVKLSPILYLRQDGHNVTIFRKTISKDKTTGEEFQRNKDIAHYGTVYQALQALIRSEYDIEKDLIKQFKDLVSLIKEAEQEIKNTFKLEVK